MTNYIITGVAPLKSAFDDRCLIEVVSRHGGFTLSCVRVSLCGDSKAKVGGDGGVAELIVNVAGDWLQLTKLINLTINECNVQGSLL